jgi:hypothetical protein
MASLRAAVFIWNRLGWTVKFDILETVARLLIYILQIPHCF